MLGLQSEEHTVSEHSFVWLLCAMQGHKSYRFCVPLFAASAELSFVVCAEKRGLCRGPEG